MVLLVIGLCGLVPGKGRNRAGGLAAALGGHISVRGCGDLQNFRSAALGSLLVLTDWFWAPVPVSVTSGWLWPFILVASN